jgi:hypothetical protein
VCAVRRRDDNKRSIDSFTHLAMMVNRLASRIGTVRIRMGADQLELADEA